mmetsp:Transcript_21668/g.26925  ORF Transcript_21668/g.26925 Transcript_21668/m.26925 type:complete len:354 (-) Transcript_21668:567-1628(-)
MGKLDPNCMRHMSREEFRTLTAVEMGMKNHDTVPVPLIVTIAGLRHGGAAKCLNTLLRFKLVYHDRSRYDGYRLTWSGYDVLALRALCQRGKVESLGSKIGEGKESDVYEAMGNDGIPLAIKFHRLGKTSFKAVKQKRDYLQGRTSAGNWFNMSRLAAQREWTFLNAIAQNTDIRVPMPIDQNRHAVVMTRLEGMTMYQLAGFSQPERVYTECIHAARTLASRGLVHCDLNEFNIFIDPDEVVTIIDFPQMVSTSHENATYYFQRDIKSIRKFFRTKIFKNVPLPDDTEFDLQESTHNDDDASSNNYNDPEEDELARYAPSSPQDPKRLDIVLQASGYPRAKNAPPKKKNCTR